jgi:hypothetical protein
VVAEVAAFMLAERLDLAVRVVAETQEPYLEMVVQELLTRVAEAVQAVFLLVPVLRVATVVRVL